MKVILINKQGGAGNELKGILHTVTDNHFVVEVKKVLKHYNRVYWKCMIVKEKKNV